MQSSSLTHIKLVITFDPLKLHTSGSVQIERHYLHNILSTFHMEKRAHRCDCSSLNDFLTFCFKLIFIEKKIDD